MRYLSSVLRDIFLAMRCFVWYNSGNKLMGGINKCIFMKFSKKSWTKKE